MECRTLQSLMNLRLTTLKFILVKNDGFFTKTEVKWLNKNIIDYKLAEFDNNMSLSSIYNSVLDNVTGLAAIFDDDTDVHEISESCLNSKADITLPVVKVDGNRLYPKKVWLNNLLKTDKISMSAVNTVMSGVIINLEVLRKKFNSVNLFDERLTFYGIDTHFFLEAHEVNCVVYCPSSYQINHSLASKSADRNSIFRRRSRRNALLVYFGAGISLSRWALGLRYISICVFRGLKFY